MAVASNSDASDRLGRPFTTDEAAMISAYLNDAEAEILRRLPDAVTDSTTDANFKQRLIAVECTAALRAARLPAGVDLVIPENGAVNYNPASQVGYIQILRREWRSLGAQNSEVVGLTPGITDVRENWFPDFEPGWPRW